MYIDNKKIISSELLQMQVLLVSTILVSYLIKLLNLDKFSQ